MEKDGNFAFKTLEELANEERFRDIPLFIYLALLFLTGIFGNSVVLHIFNKYYTHSTFRTFVIYISLVDLLSCSISIPMEIVYVSFGLKNVNSIFCMVLTFFTTLATLISIMLLCAIAVDRYRKICKPFSWQITQNSARNILILSVCVSFALTALRVATYGSRPTTIGSYNVTIYTCEVTEEMERSIVAVIAPNLLNVINITVIILIVTLYSCIALRIGKQIRMKRKMLGEVLEKTKANENSKKSDTEKEIDVVNESSRVKQPTKSDMSCKLEISRDPKHHNGKSKQTNNNRSAFVMFMVTIAFFISFAPAFPLILSKSARESNLERTLHKFFIRFYLLNSVVNPIIYGFFDPQFRNLCKEFFLCRKV